MLTVFGRSALAIAAFAAASFALPCHGAPATQDAGSPKPVSYGRRLEPKGHVVLHGAGQSPADFRSYFGALGEQRPLIYMTYLNLRIPPEGIAAWFERLQGELASYPDAFLVPQIGLSMTTDGRPEQHFEPDVAAGKRDESLAAFCRGLQQLKRPAFVRIGYEFNGGWNGYQPESYKAAWIHVVKTLRAHGLEQVATVWCMEPDGRKDVMAFYPGDEYVDWWSVDTFSPSQFAQKETLAFVQAAAEHRFPVMIGESTPRGVGVLDGELSWNRWFVPYFRFIREHPNVKAFCYISWNWSRTRQWADWGNCRIGENQVVLERYRQELADPIYLHGGPEEKVRQALGLGVRQ